MLLANSPENLKWTEHKPVMKGYEDLEMRVSYSITQSNGKIVNQQASCFYKYEQDDIGAETFNMPTAAYSTYPGRMIFEAKEVEKIQLANMINEAMANQGRKAIIKIKEKVEMISTEK